MAALWPSHFEEISRDLPTELTVGESTAILPAYQMIFHYVPTLKVGMQNNFHLQVSSPGTPTSGSPSLWAHYRVELIAHLEVNNPGVLTEPFGHIHIPWLTGTGLASTWNVRSNSAVQTTAVLWLFVHITSLSGGTEDEVPLFAIQLELRSITVLGMSTVMATVVGGFCIFISIVTAGLFVYWAAKNGSATIPAVKRSPNPSNNRRKKKKIFLKKK